MAGERGETFSVRGDFEKNIFDFENDFFEKGDGVNFYKVMARALKWFWSQNNSVPPQTETFSIKTFSTNTTLDL